MSLDGVVEDPMRWAHFPLPQHRDLAAQLRECGFTEVTCARLTPFEPYFGPVGRAAPPG